MKKFIIFCLTYGSAVIGYSQAAGYSKEVLDLINSARSAPQNFLKTYQKTIETCSPQFTKILQNASPITAVIWDNGLSSMAKETVVKKELNPTYPGEMKGLCLSSNGAGSGSAGFTAIELLCNFYTLINDESQTHFGMYSDGNSYAFHWAVGCDGKSNKYPFSYSIFPDTSKVDFAKLNSGKNASYLPSFEKDMIKEINFARYYPSIYAHIVGQHMAKTSADWGGISKDELFATNELIEELKSAQPLSILTPKECLFIASKIHGEDCKKRGFIDHTGSDASSPFARIEKYCDGAEGSENMVGTTNYDARKSVISLLVDSGISSRGHRYNMLNPEWNYIGCYHYVDENNEFSRYFTIGYAIQNFSK